MAIRGRIYVSRFAKNNCNTNPGLLERDDEKPQHACLARVCAPILLTLTTTGAFLLIARLRAGAAGFPLDDAWIHQTYARNLALRGEFSFVPGQPSAGSTAPLWTLLLVPGYWLGIAPFAWTWGIGALSLVGAAGAAYNLARQLFPEERDGPIPLLAALAVAGEWHLVWTAASGMETGLFAAGVLALLTLAVRWGEKPPTAARTFIGGLGIGALALVRPEGVLVSGGGGDNRMGAIGTGNTRKGIVTASFGTSGTIYAYSDKPVVDPKGEIAAFCDSTNAWLPLLCTMNVTVATEFVRNLFHMSHDELTEAVEKTPPGSDGLVLLPYFEGERTPNIPDGTGVFYGLNTKTFDEAHFARAAMEGVTMGMNYGLNRMKELGIKPTQIRLTGGGSKNPAWRQIAADIFNVEVVCVKIDEGAAYGAALQAMWAYRNYVGEKISIQEITDRYVKVDEKTLAFPKPSHVKIYKELQKLQDELSVALRKTFSRHREYLKRHVAK